MTQHDSASPLHIYVGSWTELVQQAMFAKYLCELGIIPEVAPENLARWDIAAYWKITL